MALTKVTKEMVESGTADVLLGNDTSGDPAEITVGAGLDLTTSTLTAADITTAMMTAATLTSLENKFYVGELNRAMNGATGTVAETGVGFTPKALIVFATIANVGGYASWGFGTTTLSRCISHYAKVTANAWTTGAYLVAMYQSSVLHQRCTISSFDSDGFTLSWTRTGATESGTITVNYIAIA